MYVRGRLFFGALRFFRFTARPLVVVVLVVVVVVVVVVVCVTLRPPPPCDGPGNIKYCVVSLFFGEPSIECTYLASDLNWTIRWHLRVDFEWWLECVHFVWCV